MWNKIIIISTLSFSMNVSAFLPTMDKLSSFSDFSQLPKFPELPKLEGFDTTSLQKLYNQFTEDKPDFAREDRMIGEIEDAVMDGDVEYLPLANDKEVFSIYMEADADKPKGGVIVLHSRGYHANWESVIKPIRVGMADKGWHSLSVQMPVLDKQATYYNYVPIFPYAHERIVAAIEFYEQRGIDNIVLIAHGCGAHMAMSYFDKYGDDKIKAYVGIGMGATDYKQKVIKRMPLDMMLKPVLDVYGEKDFPGVRRSADERKWLMTLTDNQKSTQKVIKNADHYYKEKGTADELVLVINQWLSGLNK